MRLVVEADGGSRGNPGPAGYGALVRDAANGAVLARRNGFLGIATNNVAEYNGLLAGLRAAAAVDPAAAVEVRMDSKLVVEQLAGRWQVKNAVLRPLAREAATLAASFPEIRFVWIPRARNGDADALANEAMDARRGTYDALDDPPSDSASQAIPAPGWGSPLGRPARLLLLRHGQTAMSIDRRFSGRGDPPLTAVGREQAERAATRLATHGNLTAVVSSPLGRTRETADLVASRLGLALQTDPGWSELDFGSWEGLTFAEVKARDPDGLQEWLTDPVAAPHAGESLAALTARVRTARDGLALRYADSTVLVVSHVTPIKAVARLALQAPPEALFCMHLDLCSLTSVDVYPDGSGVLRCLNDTAHLNLDTSMGTSMAEQQGCVAGQQQQRDDQQA